MRVAILADESNAVLIRQEIRALFRFAEENAVFADAKADGGADLVVVDADEIGRGAFTAAYENAGTLLFLDGCLIDPDETEYFEARLIGAKRWTELRRLNNAKIRLNHLRKKTVLDTKPNFLQLELTNACNGGCIMCPHFYLDKKIAGHMQPEVLEKIKPILPYVQVAVLHGNGEPFLYPYIEAQLELYRSYGISVSACTNLSVFNERLAGLVNGCISDLRVSCDACTKEVYEAIRLGLSFETLKRNLTLLRDRCPDVSKALTFVIMRQNISEIPQMIRFAREYGFREVVYSDLLPSAALENEADAPLHYAAAVKKQLEAAEDLAAAVGIQITYPEVYRRPAALSAGKNLPDGRARPPEELEALRERLRRVVRDSAPVIEDVHSLPWQERLIPCSGVCDWMIEKTYVDIEGNVSVCCINSTHRIGSLKEKSFVEIWNDRSMRELRAHFYGGRLPAFCHRCQFILNGSLRYLKDVKTDAAFMK